MKYRFKRWMVKLRRTTSKELEFDDVQKKAYDIAIRLINDKESELMIDFKTGRRGVMKKDVSVKINTNRITIINGVYHYDIGIDDRIRDSIIEKFNDKLSRKFNAFDNKVSIKVNNSLDSIRLGIDEPKQ